jgi:predicted enzyme related to lactoylglutathione lyase
MSVSLYAVTLDCSNATELAAFWSTVLDRRVDDGATEDFAAIGLGDPPELRPHWMFIKVPEGKATKNRIHPDLMAADLDAEVQRIVDAGGVRQAAFNQDGARWITLLDPEGNEFDVVAQSS